MKTSKGFAPIIAIVIVLVVGLAASTAVYFTAREMATNTNKNTNQAAANENSNQNANLNLNTNATADETANWKTYGNELYGYEVKYPADKVSIVLGDILEGGTVGNPGFTIKSGGHFALGVWDNLENLGVEEWFNKNLNAVASKYEFKETTAGSEKAYSAVNLSYAGTCHIEWIIIPKLKKMYTFRVELCDKDQKTSLETFKNIVTTFKFDETAGWKTYTNTTRGYSFKYPSEYSVALQSTVDSVWFVDADSNNVLAVKFRLDSVDGSLNTWFDTGPDADARLGDRTGKRFDYKYCDGPGCGSETVAFVVQHQGKLLGLEFLGDYELSATEQQILSTFQFTK